MPVILVLRGLMELHNKDYRVLFNVLIAQQVTIVLDLLVEVLAYLEHIILIAVAQVSTVVCLVQVGLLVPITP